MPSPISEYHGNLGFTRPSVDRLQFSDHVFFSDSLKDLEDSAKVTGRLLAVLEQDPCPEFADAIRMNRDLYQETCAAVERRYARIERLETDPLMVDQLRIQALALVVALPISQYLASIRPGIILWRDGNTYHGPCPYAGHDFDLDSFRVYDDDYAWCQTCGGGNLFRVIGMVEAISSPEEQVRRAAEIAGIKPSGVRRYHPQHRSLPTPFSGEQRRKDHTGQGSVFQPIRIVNGQVSR